MYNTRLKELREEPVNFIRQKEVADIIGVHVSVYSKYENRTAIIPIEHLNTLCNYFNVSFDYIFEFSEQLNYDNTNSEIDKINAGARLKEIRKENKLTQTKLASLLNTVQPVIANYEKGKFLIATPFLYSICKKYHISANYLLGKTNEPKYIK